MARIKEYVSQVGLDNPQPQRQATPVSTAEGSAAIGRGLQDLGGAIYRQAEQSQISDLNNKLTKYAADTTNGLDAETNSGNLNPVKFNEKVDADLGQMGDDILTPGAREFYNRRSAELKGYFAKSAYTAHAELQGEKRKLNAISSLENSSSIVMKDFTAFDQERNAYKAYLDTEVKNGLPAKAAMQLAAKADKDLAESAIRGMYRLDPSMGKQALDTGSYDQFFSGDDKRRLYGEIDTEERARRADAAYLSAQQEKLRKEAQEQTANEFVQRFVDGKLRAKDIARSNLDPTDKRTFINWLKQDADGPIKTNNSTYLTLFDRLTTDDPNKRIWDTKEIYAQARNLSPTDMDRLLKIYEGKKTPEGLEANKMLNQATKQAKAALVQANPMLGMRDPQGEAALQQFTIDFQQEYKDLLKKGKTPSDLLNPSSPDYITEKIINKYRKTPDQLINSIADQMNSNTLNEDGTTLNRSSAIPVDPAKVRQKGESIEDWKKRIKTK